MMRKKVLSRILIVVLLLLLLLGASMGSGCGGPPVLTVTFITSPQTLEAGRVSHYMTIQVQDAKGVPQKLKTDTIINLTSTSPTGRFDTNPAGAFNGTITSVTIPGGSITANFYYKDTTAGTLTITGKESLSQGWVAATQEEVVNAGALDHFAFAVIENQTKANVFEVSITAQDAYNNTVTSYSEANTLGDTTGTISPAVTGAFVEGTWTDNISIGTAQGGVTITTAGGGKSGVSNVFDIVSGVIGKLVFITPGQAIEAGIVSGVVTVLAQDTSGNTYNVTADTVIGLTSSSATGTFYSDAEGLNAITQVTIKGGECTANFYYKDTTAGTLTITGKESPSLGWLAATQTETIKPVVSPTDTSTTGIPIFLVIVVGVGSIILGLLIGYLIFFRAKFKANRKQKAEMKSEEVSTTIQSTDETTNIIIQGKSPEVEQKKVETAEVVKKHAVPEVVQKKAEIAEVVKKQPVPEVVQKKAEIAEAVKKQPVPEVVQKKAEIAEIVKKQPVPEVVQKKAEIAEIVKKQPVPEVAQKKAETASTVINEQAAELLMEIEINRRIANTGKKGSMIDFQTQVWDFKHEKVNSIPDGIREELTKAYTTIYHANGIIWLSSQLGRRSPNLEENYAQLCNSIAGQLDKIKQLIEQS